MRSDASASSVANLSRPFRGAKHPEPRPSASATVGAGMPDPSTIQRICTPEQLRRYVARVGYAGDLAPSSATLTALHEAHLRGIPFENLEIMLGRPMCIDPDELFRDLVDRRRGGYCFQMNELFALVLATLGFGVERFAARVWFGNPVPMPPRSHQCLRVTDRDGGRWFCDVGFGGSSPLRPIAWEFDTPVDQDLACYLLTRANGLGVLVRTRIAGTDWQDMISFTEEVQHPVDFRYANFAISTMPDSRFVRSRIASLVKGDARLNFQDGKLRRITATGVTVESLSARQEDELLRGEFGLDLPAALPWLAPTTD